MSTRPLAGGAPVRAECLNLGKSIKMIAMVDMIVILLALVLLVVAILYHYLKKVDAADTAAQTKKNKLISILVIISTVLVAIGAGLALIQFSVNGKTAKTCLQ